MLPLLMTVAVRAEEVASGRPLAPGERERLTRLYVAHSQLAWRVLRRCGLDRVRADDGLQQVFLVVLRRMAGLRDDEMRGFVCGCAVMVARKMKQRLGREAAPLAAVPTDGPATPHQHAEHRERVALLDAVLRRFDEGLRDVFVLQVVEGLSKRETALALNLPEGTVATRLRRARSEFETVLRQLTGGADA